LLVLRMERFANVMSTRADSSVRVIRLSNIIRSRFNLIGIIVDGLNGECGFFLEREPLPEYFSQRQDQQAK
jgi:hypothetical protein